VHRNLTRSLWSPLLLAALALSLAPAAAHAACQLNSPSGKIKHVVYVEFDNVHFTRDNPNVPSDLEQMPNLLNFLENNGTLDAGDHAVLISHTANDILTTETGLYSDRDGIGVSNNFGVFSPITTADPLGVLFPSSFFYWTDAVQDITPATSDPLFALLTETGQNVPAPWVPFTRAGCDVGAFSTANIVLERTPFDTVKVFGAGSPQTLESGAQQTTDFVGEAIHCALGSPLCTMANGAEPDLLPDEPGGYSNYEALFGAKYINTAFGAPLADLNGSIIMGSGATGPGFPGFNPTATQTLGAVATMLEKGVPVVFAYIAYVHDNRSAFGTFGPGQPGYEAQLAQYNTAFGQFFARLANDGIDQSNTLFIFTPDEGDHFAGSAPSPANCDGIHTLCNYPGLIGELQINLNQLTANAGVATQYAIHTDDAPNVYIQHNPKPADPTTRTLERTMAGLTAVNPYTGSTDHLMAAMADPIEESMLHMVIPEDSARTPSFTFFGDPDYFFQSSGPATPVIGNGFAWNHGDIQPEIARTFIGVVGPGVQQLGATSAFFSDHVDVRPTLMFLVGLTDDYTHDGRVLSEIVNGNILPKGMHDNRKLAEALGQAYKSINAPFGALAMASLKVSTAALASNSPGDTEYLSLENEIQGWTEQRDSLAAQMKSILEAAEFKGARIDTKRAQNLIAAAAELVAQAESAASSL